MCIAAMKNRGSAAAKFAILWPNSCSHKEALRDFGFCSTFDFKQTIDKILESNEISKSNKKHISNLSKM